MPKIKKLTGLEILDSRGRPTVQATCELASGAMGTASVPAGASTGTAEALELRDGDPQRYRGLGCRRAAHLINHEIHDALSQGYFADQAEIDQALIELDGTPNKARLGANAVLAVSLAAARALAVERGLPLYRYLSGIAGETPRALPRPMINLFSGGKHAGGQTPLQDVLVVPVSAQTLSAALAMTFEVYQAAAELAYRKYAMRALRADEGGLAPAFPSAEAMFEDALDAIRAAGLEPGQDMALAVDVAATHLYAGGRYHLDGEALDSPAMIERLLQWVERFSLVSIEDGLSEDDWSHWPELCARAAARVLVIGDDLLCTSPARVRRAIALRAATGLLLKVNQVGTLTEAVEAYRAARSAGWRVVVSARSGETEDNWLADLAVGWAADLVKIGSITQSDRLAKYNRLLEIEAATGLPLLE